MRTLWLLEYRCPAYTKTWSRVDVYPRKKDAADARLSRELIWPEKHDFRLTKWVRA